MGPPGVRRAPRQGVAGGGRQRVLAPAAAAAVPPAATLQVGFTSQTVVLVLLTLIVSKIYCFIFIFSTWQENAQFALLEENTIRLFFELTACHNANQKLFASTLHNILESMPFTGEFFNVYALSFIS